MELSHAHAQRESAALKALRVHVTSEEPVLLVPPAPQRSRWPGLFAIGAAAVFGFVIGRGAADLPAASEVATGSHDLRVETSVDPEPAAGAVPGPSVMAGDDRVPDMRVSDVRVSDARSASDSGVPDTRGVHESRSSDPDPDVLPLVGQRVWTVSLMTLSNRATADTFAEEVRAAGLPVEIVAVGALWRVCSGAFATEADARAHARSSEARLALDSVWITRRSGSTARIAGNP